MSIIGLRRMQRTAPLTQNVKRQQATESLNVLNTSCPINISFHGVHSDAELSRMERSGVSDQPNI